MRPRTRALLATSLLAASLSAVDCTIDPFCREDQPGCSADPCTDGLRDGDETDVDCGGSCGSCAIGQSCQTASDCGDDRCFEATCCAPPCVAWARRYGGPGTDKAWHVASLADGTLIVAGEFQDTVDFGGGPVASKGGTDVFVAAYAPGGGLLWLRRIGGSGEDSLPVLGVANDRVWVAGSFQSPTLDTGAGVLQGPPDPDADTSLFVLVLDREGNPLSARALNGQGNVGARTLAPTADGGIVLTGQIGSLDFGDGTVLAALAPGGERDVFVAKLDAGMSRVWSRQLGDDSDDTVFGAAIGGGGDVTLLADSPTNTAFGGPPVAGPGLILAQYAGADGAFRWSRSYGKGVTGYSLSADASGFLVVGDLGPTADEADLGTGKLFRKGVTDGVVAAFDPSGAAQWVTQVASTSETHGLAVVRDGAGGVVAALRLTGTLTFAGAAVSGPTAADSLVLLGLGAGGTFDWARDEGGIVVERSISLSPTPGGQVFVLGSYAGTLSLGMPLASAGGADAFVAEIVP